MDNQKLEQEIKDKGLTAPRITLAQLESKVAGVYYHVPPGTTLTLCVITLQNGFTVTGESACASITNFDAEIGQRLAYENAFRKIWVLEGYLLRENLYIGSL